MTAAQNDPILFPGAGQPAGRIVMGSLYQPQEKDQQGNPLVIKTGPNKGQPTKKWFFALAIKKGSEGHWAHTEWGKRIWAIGHAAFPQAAQAPTFAWKVQDGDSQVPNKNGRKNSETEGMPGHWIVNFQSSFAPKVVRQDGTPINEPNAVKCGDYVEVLGSCAGNDQATNPGVYLNHVGVAFAGYGVEIKIGPDLRQAGFGRTTLPPGASATPVSTGAAGAAAPAAPGALPPPPAAASPPPPAAAAPPAPTPVQPAASFTAPPPPTGAAPPPPAASGPQMTAKAAGRPYNQFIAAGWNDAQLRAEGYMV